MVTKTTITSMYNQYQLRNLYDKGLYFGFRPYIFREDLSNIVVAVRDNPEEDRGMIYRAEDMSEHYIDREYFDKTFQLAPVTRIPNNPYHRKEIVFPTGAKIEFDSIESIDRRNRRLSGVWNDNA